MIDNPDIFRAAKVVIGRHSEATGVDRLEIVAKGERSSRRPK